MVNNSTNINNMNNYILSKPTTNYVDRNPYPGLRQTANTEVLSRLMGSQSFFLISNNNSDLCKQYKSSKYLLPLKMTNHYQKNEQHIKIDSTLCRFKDLNYFSINSCMNNMGACVNVENKSHTHITHSYIRLTYINGLHSCNCVYSCLIDYRHMLLLNSFCGLGLHDGSH
jgi:hypothetical protein